MLFLTSKENYLPHPIIKETFNPTRTSLTYYLKNVNNTDALTKLESDIVQYLNENGPSSAKNISEKLEKNITTVKLSLYSLMKMSLIFSTGTIKDKKYFTRWFLTYWFWLKIYENYRFFAYFLNQIAVRKSRCQQIVYKHALAQAYISKNVLHRRKT